MNLYCKRCGQHFNVCPHWGTSDLVNKITEAHAARIKARYALGKQFDPEHHDTNDYATEDTRWTS